MSNRRVALLLLLAAGVAGCIEVERDEDPKDLLPVARITVEPASGPAPLAVSASGEASTAAKGTIASYAWAFGDGSSASGATATHTYATAGAYAITLTVTDSKGRTASTTANVVATGPDAIYDGSVFDGTAYQDEPGSGVYDTTTLQ